ncbi:hypothetical protein AAHH80_36910, partial [Burkholderia pseudomallei]
VLLCRRHRRLGPTLHGAVPDRHFECAASPVNVNTERAPWAPLAASPRRAAVSSVGVSGTNAHLVGEDYVHPAAAAPEAGGP